MRWNILAAVSNGVFTDDKFTIEQRIGILGFAVLALLPLGFDVIFVMKFIGALYFAMFVMSWDVVSGYTKQISFGHSFFFALGGYTSAILNLNFGLHPLLTIPAGIAVAAVGGLVIGFPALRLRGPYLSLITLVAPLLLHQLFIVFSDTFGGEIGLSSPDSLLSFDGFGTEILANYYLSLALFIAIFLLLYAITRSNAGEVFSAIGEDEIAVEAVGIDTVKFKLFAFVLSASVGGLAGAVLVHTPVGSPQPSQLLALMLSIEVIIAAILGGMGTIVGPAFAGIAYYVFRDFLGGLGHQVPLLDVPLGNLDIAITLAFTFLLLYYLPEGIVQRGFDFGRQLHDKATNRGETA